MISRHRARLVAQWLPLVLGTATNLVAIDTPAELHERLQEWRYSRQATPIPQAGLTLTIDDVATVTLDQGVVRLAEPVLEGTPPGLVFEGSGRIQLVVPDPVELRQLRRFLGDPTLDRFEQTFKRMVLRTSEPTLLQPFSAPPDGPFDPVRWATARHDHWLRMHRLDADARLLAARLEADDRFTRLDLETADHGWISLDYDALRREEIALTRFHPKFGLVESWLSLDRSQDRLDSGRPGPAATPGVDLTHIAITADLTRASRKPLRGLSRTQPVDGRLTARLDIDLRKPATRLQAYLHPLAEVKEVRLPDGRVIPFVRDPIGTRSATLDRDLYDDSLLILPPEPLNGRVDGLEVDYELRLDGFARGRLWYPAFASGTGSLSDRHTAHLTITSQADYAVRAVGRRLDETEHDGLRTSVWAVESPVKMATLAFARRHHEAITELDGAPTVAVLSSLGGSLTRERVEAVGRDVARATAYFQELFDHELDIDRLQAAVIPASHGQAFEGFLHIGDFSTGVDTVHAGELFRAHEVAHQWWGHRVGWVGYRDQWLSEALAEYSAMMFVEDTMDGGERYFRQMLAAFSDEVRGSLRSTFSQFSRPGASTLNRQAADRVGPIGHGYRCIVGEAPRAYLSQIYTKGALVLHMLRTLTVQVSGSPDAFTEILRTFIRRFDGSYATTADFQAVVEEVVPADWSWFFDQWILGAQIPSYRWSHDLRSDGEVHELHVTIEQHDVDEGFRMMLPVEVTFPDASSTVLLAGVGGESQSHTWPLPSRPSKVELDPEGSILARLKGN